MQKKEKDWSSEKRKQINGILEVGRTEQDIGALDGRIILELSNDNIQPPVVLMYNLLQVISLTSLSFGLNQLRKVYKKLQRQT